MSENSNVPGDEGMGHPDIRDFMENIEIPEAPILPEDEAVITAIKKAVTSCLPSLTANINSVDLEILSAYTAGYLRAQGLLK